MSVDKRERERDQARLRAARKRQRDRETRLDVRAIAIADQMPASWRQDWLKRVKRNREGKERASVEVNKAAASIPDEHRAEFLASHWQNTKVSINELRNRFVREKSRAKQWPEKPQVDNWAPAPRDDPVPLLSGFSVPLSNGMQIHLDQQEEVTPGSWLWWTIALDGARWSRPAMAWRSAQKAAAAASKCHCACVTSRPEYWRVASQPPIHIFVR
jgi:hypothetical protein